MSERDVHGGEWRTWTKPCRECGGVLKASHPFGHPSQGTGWRHVEGSYLKALRASIERITGKETVHMKAICPTSDEHKRFTTVAHVATEWVVDELGNFIEDGDAAVGDVVAKPRPENTWTCVDCGETARVMLT